ncbi:acetolactate synthase III large subunit [Roseobacter sp. SK209-2-6]|nr:acetolactate synthase III large subunit [Roseobacter sp. SK209-2-6]
MSHLTAEYLYEGKIVLSFCLDLFQKGHQSDDFE